MKTAFKTIDFPLLQKKKIYSPPFYFWIKPLKKSYLFFIPAYLERQIEGIVKICNLTIKWKLFRNQPFGRRKKSQGSIPRTLPVIARIQNTGFGMLFLST